MLRALVTGFGPYGAWQRNPTGIIARDMDGTWIGERYIKALQLPVSVEGCDRAMSTIYKELERYDIILHLGLHPRIWRCRLERVALNLHDFSIPDCNGMLIRESPIVKGGENAYFSTISVRDLKAKLEAMGHRTRISNSTGTYLCNHVYYLTLHQIHSIGLRIRCIFLHMPSEKRMDIREQKALVKDVLEVLASL